MTSNWRKYAPRVTEPGSEPGQQPSQLRDRYVVLLIVGGTFGLQGLTLVTGVLSARMLGVEGRGQVALVFALGLMASQLTFGGSLPNAIAKNLAQRQLAARDGLRRIARRRVGLLVPTSVAAAGVMLVLQRDQPVGENWALAVAVAVMTLQTIVFRLIIGSLQGEIRHLARMAIVGMIPQALFTLALTTAFVAGWDWSAIDVLLSFFVASAVGLGFGWAALARPTRRPEDELDEDELWSEARKNYVSSIGPIDGVGLDRIFVGALLGVVELGLYAAATAVSNLCRIVGNAVSVIVLPRVAMNHADPVGQRAVIRQWVPIAAGLIALVVIALELVVGPAIRLAFGDEFEGAIRCAHWLVLADGLLGFRKVLVAVLQGQGRGGTASWIELAVTPVMVLGIVTASFYDSLTGIGLTMVLVGVLSCVGLGLAVTRGNRERQPVSPPSTTRI
ncbi:MAG: Polysaccharide biosynthesis protein [Nocardioides sp.]|nr:Polysaccharide biosynthesis protein [Nocardioides sp.]